jgi:hypothetical protein
MAATAEALAQAVEAPLREPAPSAAKARDVLRPWIGTQSINVVRHAAALRPFRPDEFGTGAAAPTPGHLEEVNKLLGSLRRGLLRYSKAVSGAAAGAQEDLSTARLVEFVDRKDKAQHWVQAIEKIWDFYFELFGQRQSRYANWLLSCDRIALDCYRAAYLGLGVAKSIPAPPPFCYMRTGFSPATFRRGIRLKKLGKQINRFPLVELPYHRLVNPWTLGAVLHEISHNLQTDLGLSKPVPHRVAARLLKAGMPRTVAMTWTRWNREMFADMSALLLGGHPTPYLRMLITVELLPRMGFTTEAEKYDAAWKKIYGNGTHGDIPLEIRKTFGRACPVAVDAMCFQPYIELGKKSLAQVIVFGRKEQQMIEEAARRLAAGTDPGIIPERFVIGAARLALEGHMARPGVISRNFYKALASG